MSRQPTSQPAIALDVAAECWAPTVLGPARQRGFLWCRPAGKSSVWKRRYVLCCANFLYLFDEKEEERPSKPVGALCFEDLLLAPLEAPAEKEVAAFSANAFLVAPRADDKAKSGSMFSSSAGRRYQFVAETEQEVQQWATALNIWRHAPLADDRAELAKSRIAMQRVTEQQEAAMVEFQRLLTEAEEQAAAERAAAEQTHAQLLEIEREKRAMEAELVRMREAVGRSEEQREAAEADMRKLRMFTALHKSSRDALQEKLQQLQASLEAQATANAGSSPTDPLPPTATFASTSSSFERDPNPPKKTGFAFDNRSPAGERHTHLRIGCASRGMLVVWPAPRPPLACR